MKTCHKEDARGRTRGAPNKLHWKSTHLPWPCGKRPRTRLFRLFFYNLSDMYVFKSCWKDVLDICDLYSIQFHSWLEWVSILGLNPMCYGNWFFLFQFLWSVCFLTMKKLNVTMMSECDWGCYKYVAWLHNIMSACDLTGMGLGFWFWFSCVMEIDFSFFNFMTNIS